MRQRGRAQRRADCFRVVAKNAEIGDLDAEAGEAAHAR